MSNFKVNQYKRLTMKRVPLDGADCVCSFVVVSRRVELETPSSGRACSKMSVDTKSSMSDKKCQPSAGSHRKQHHHSSSTLGEPKVALNFVNSSPVSGSSPNDIEQLRQELDCEKKNRCGQHQKK